MARRSAIHRRFRHRGAAGHPGAPARDFADFLGSDAGEGLLAYRTALIGIAVHSAQSILVLGLVLALVLKG